MSNDRVRFRIGKMQRIRSSKDFARVYDLKQRAGDRNLLAFGRQNGTPFTRFGLSVSKKHGNAVVRARLKRLLREAFRLSQHELPAGWDFVLIPKQGANAELADYRHSLQAAAKKLAKRFADVPVHDTRRTDS